MLLQNGERLRERNNDDLKLLYPTVYIENIGQGYGSGVVVATRVEDGKNVTYVVTAAHVVEGFDIPEPEPLPESDDGEEDTAIPQPPDDYEPPTPSEPLRIISVAAVSSSGIWDHKVFATVVAEDSEKDLALLRIVGYKHPYVAKVATVKDLKKIKTLDDVYAVGWQYGVPRPLRVYGEIFPDRSSDHWITTSPIFFGYSGCGLYDAGSHQLLGIVVAIGSSSYHVNPHMGYVVPVSILRDFLSSNKFGDLLD